MDFGDFVFSPDTVFAVLASALGAGVALGALGVLLTLFYGRR